MQSILSTSPPSVVSQFLAGLCEELGSKSKIASDSDTSDSCSTSPSSASALSLEEFIRVIPDTIRSSAHTKSMQDSGQEYDETALERGTIDNSVTELFRRLALDKDEWERFCHFEPLKNYTRNLIATDGKTFTLMLLCWNPGKESPIHDHPCDGCWLRVCEGSVREIRYRRDDDSDSLQCTSDNTFHEGQLDYITDSMGYHKVGNPSSHVPAVTMHLYSPPFQSCKIWLDPSKASKPSKSCVCYHSEYGCTV